MGNDHTFMEEVLPQPDARERRLAALAHISILVFLAGFATGPFWPCFAFPFIPALILIVMGRKTKWLSFHAWQATIFQLILLAVFLFIGIPAFLFIFAKCAPGFGQNSSGCNDIFLPTTLVTLTALFLLPLGMVAFGTVKGALLLSGKDIAYPLISHLLRKWMKIEQH